MNGFFEFFEFSWFESLIEVGSSYAPRSTGSFSPC